MTTNEQLKTNPNAITIEADNSGKTAQKKLDQAHANQVKAFRETPVFQAHKVFEEIDSGEIDLPSSTEEQLRYARCELILANVAMHAANSHDGLSLGGLTEDVLASRIEEYSEKVVEMSTHSGEIAVSEPIAAQETQTPQAERYAFKETVCKVGNTVLAAYRRGSNFLLNENEPPRVLSPEGSV